MVRHNFESSLLVGVNLKKHLDPLSMELKENILSKRNDSFSQGEDEVLRNQGRFCVQYVDGLRELIMEEAHLCWYYT